MTKPSLSGGTVHRLPADFKLALQSALESRATWQDITPLARNEWVCWVISVKSAETRSLHIKRAIRELAEGKRRPCCWYGCIHRPDKTPSPSVQHILRKKKQST